MERFEYIAFYRRAVFQCTWLWSEAKRVQKQTEQLRGHALGLRPWLFDLDWDSLAISQFMTLLSERDC